MNRRAFIRSATGALLVPAFPAIVRAITPQQRAAVLAARPKASAATTTPAWYDAITTSDGYAYFGADTTYADLVSITQNGTATSLRLYIDAGGAGNLKLALYNSSRALLASGVTTTTPAGYRTVAISVQVTIGDYWVAYNCDSTSRTYKKITVGSGGQLHWTGAYADFPTDPLPAGGGTASRKGMAGLYVS